MLDLGCGTGEPITRVLINHGFEVFGVDASERMIAEFRRRFPQAHAECCSAEDSELFNRTFDGTVAWGLLFLLPADTQRVLLRRIASALRPGGEFLFTAPEQAVTWKDSLTGRESLSLGVQTYTKILVEEGLIVDAGEYDEGDNHYFFVSRPRSPNS